MNIKEFEEVLFEKYTEYKSKRKNEILLRKYPEPGKNGNPYNKTGYFSNIFVQSDPETNDESVKKYTYATASLDRSAELTRKHAAVLIHEFLYNILKEPDETDISPAFKLADIYECRVCAIHIAQVYCKGIMKAGEYFDLNGKIDREEAESIIEAAFDRDKRSGNEGSTYYNNYEKAVFIENSTAQSDNVGIDSNDEHERAADLRDNCEHEGVADAENNGEFADTTDQENYSMQDRKKEPIRIDIRSRAEYALGHAEDTVNIPMDDLINNPYNVLQASDDFLYNTNSGLTVHDDPIRVTQQVCPNLNTPIEIISDDLSRLETTANCLNAAGFRFIRSNLTDFHDT